MQKQTDNLQGLVISYFGNSVAVEAEDGQVFQCHLHRNQELPVVGDKVIWHLETGNSGVITEILERKSLLVRGAGRGKSKAIAANIDACIVVMAPPPIFSDYLVNRYLVASELLGIEPIIVLNKIDLLTDATRASALACLEPYRQVPYTVVLSSACTSGGLDALSKVLEDKTAVLVGPSGVGKSSIINALGILETIRVGDVTAKGVGKHTTTATRLYHLLHGGHLIDSPGVREFNLWAVSKQDVLQGFKEFQAVIGQCRFRDCQHMQEPGCTVHEAVSNGRISPERYASYQALMKEVDAEKKQY